MKDYALIIGNDGLGDMISYYGMVKYFSTIYKFVLVACDKRNYDNIKYLYEHENIKLYVFNKEIQNDMYEFCKDMMLNNPMFDIYPLGNYGALTVNLKEYTKTFENGETRKIIHNYPISYYEDVNIPIEYASKYFNVIYPPKISEIYDELLTKYNEYIVFHQKGSNVPYIDFVSYQKIDINKILTIDVNKNLYNEGHKFYNIAQKFVNLESVVYYKKLLENATELYLIDSCLHALSLIIDVSKSKKRFCYQRESRFEYGFNKFTYMHLIFCNN